MPPEVFFTVSWAVLAYLLTCLGRLLGGFRKGFGEHLGEVLGRFGGSKLKCLEIVESKVVLVIDVAFSWMELLN